MANITDEQMSMLLTMLERNLEIITDYMDETALNSLETELTQYIQSAYVFIQREGITLDVSDFGDGWLVVMYASWLYSKRKDGNAIMPRMLRYNLNNRVFQEKVNNA